MLCLFCAYDAQLTPSVQHAPQIVNLKKAKLEKCTLLPNTKYYIIVDLKYHVIVHMKYYITVFVKYYVILVIK